MEVVKGEGRGEFCISSSLDGDSSLRVDVSEVRCEDLHVAPVDEGQSRVPDLGDGDDAFVAVSRIGWQRQPWVMPRQRYEEVARERLSDVVDFGDIDEVEPNGNGRRHTVGIRSQSNRRGGLGQNLAAYRDHDGQNDQTAFQPFRTSQTLPPLSAF